MSNNVADDDFGRVGGIRSKPFIFKSVNGSVTTSYDGVERDYVSEDSCLGTIYEKMATNIAPCGGSYNSGFNYSSTYNSWIMSTGFMFTSTNQKNYAKGGSREAIHEATRTVRWSAGGGIVEYEGYGFGSSARVALNRAAYVLMNKIIVEARKKNIPITAITKELNQVSLRKLPRVQIDHPEKLTDQGDMTQSSDKKENTIITQDQAQNCATPEGELDDLHLLTSTEPVHEFPTVTKRWMPLDEIAIKTTHELGTIVKTYFLPESIYSTAKCAPNLTPFETFIYGRTSMELRIISNASKFHCGKVIVSSKYDSYQADGIMNGYQSALARNHVIIDLSTNNEGVLQIPFRYHRPWMRIVKNSNGSEGVRPSKYCSVYVQILSPLQTGKDGPSDIGLRLFYRFTHVEFAAMSYRVAVQGLGLEDIVTPTTSRALREVLRGAEKAFDQLGSSRNQDKPGCVEGSIIVPHPRLNFGTGKGMIDVSPLRVNPHTLTNFHKTKCPTDEPKTFYELSRIWGVTNTFKWSKESASGVELLSLNIDPTLRSYTADYEGEPTPLEYACSNFMFWSGTIELRFDFVSTSFHTGTVQISAEFGRQTVAANECESSSTYTKMFQLGEQKSVTFTVPYIYDTVMRRTTGDIWNIYPSATTTSDEIKYNSLTIAPESRTFVKVKVMNPLRPVASAPQEIAVLVYMRAGANFTMHGLKGSSFLAVKNITAMDSFPRDYSDAARVKRSVSTLLGNATTAKPITPTTTKPAIVLASNAIPLSERNEWGERKPEFVKFVRTQMYNGNDDDKDRTDDFNSGQSVSLVQTLDSHMSFKDLLRRPYLICDRIALSPQQGGGFFIPLMPPTRDMCYLYKTNSANSIWAPTLQLTSAPVIMDMFRMWRGSMRYTIVVNKGIKPIYTSLIPHSGTRLIGNQVIFAREKYPLYGSNFCTDILVPTVNPTAVIEAPYDTENTWTLSFDEDAQRNYSWRDKGDYNSGHICIEVQEDVNLTIFWSAGDDFEITNFYGIPLCKSNGWAYRWNDLKAKVQMDFVSEDTSTSVVRVLKNTFSAKNMTRAVLSQVPFVGPPLAIASVASELEGDIKVGISKVAAVADKFSMRIDDVCALLTEAVNKASSSFQNIVNGGVIVYDLLLDILMAWMEKSWRIVGVALIRFITKIIPSVLKTVGTSILAYGDKLATAVQWLFEDHTPRVQVDNNEANIVGILVGLVGTIFGVVLDPRRARPIPLAFVERVTSSAGASYLMNILRFVQSTFDTIRTLVMEALGFVSPQAMALRLLSEKNTQINEFIREAQLLTSEVNGSMVGSPTFRLRMWRTIMMAHQIQRIICQVPSNCVSAQLGRLCADVIKAGNEKFVDLSASPVRFEPFVICIEGPPGIGKSHCTEGLVDTLLDSIGFKHPVSSHIYYRTAGEKFWSGYRDQPVIVYDEWMNTTDPQRNVEQIAELMKLKSTALFIPEMAHLDEKKIRGNPLVVIILCNGAFTSLSDYATYPEAIRRRRDIVLRCELVDEYKGKDLRSYDPTELEDNPHLKFCAYRSVHDQRSLMDQWKSFKDTETFLASRWKKYYSVEVQKVKRRTETALKYLRHPEGEIRLEDPFTLFYELNTHIQDQPELGQNAWTPYEQMETAVNLVNNAMEQNNHALPRQDIPEVNWEDPIPDTQGVGTFLLGMTRNKFWMTHIARATKTQLVQWESQQAVVRTRPGKCRVCLTERACAYVCGTTEMNEGDARHELCAACYHGVIYIGNASCPMCRCGVMRPILGFEEERNLALWLRIAIKCGRGVQWFADKVLEYYGWAHTHYWKAFIIEWLMAMAFGLLEARVDPCSPLTYGSGTALAMMMEFAYSTTTWAIDVGRAILQSDEWDAVEEPGNACVEPIREDHFVPVLNEHNFDTIVHETKQHSVCFHHLLRCRGKVLDGSTWIVADALTRKQVRVSIHLCSLNCHLTSGDYHLIVEQHLNQERIVLRGLYIDYVNNPTKEASDVIPCFYRPVWMTMSDEEPITTSWWDLLCDKWSEYRTMIYWCVSVTGVITAMISLYRMATIFSQPGAQVGGASYDPTTSPRHRRMELRRDTGERRYFQQSDETASPFYAAQAQIARNMIKLIVTRGDKCVEMFGTGLFNRYVLIPRHYVVELKEAVIQSLQIEAFPLGKPQLRSYINFEVKDFIESTNTDLAYLRMPASFPLFKDIRKFIPFERDYASPLTTEGVLMAGPPKGQLYMREIAVEIYGVNDKQVVLDQKNNAFEVRDILEYSYSQPGVCGSLLLRRDHNRPIISMHFAGVGEGVRGVGYGIILSQESLGALVQLEVPTQTEDIVYETIEEAKFVFDEGIRIDYLGSVRKDQVPYIPTKSKLVKSSLFGALGLTTTLVPAILDKKDGRYLHTTTPLFEGVKKHGVLTKDFNTSELYRVKEQLWDGWISNMRPLVTQPHTLTLEQAVVGFLDNEHYKPMDLSTSAGYPYVLGTHKKKSDYISVQRNINEQMIGVSSIHPVLENIMQKNKLLRKQGIIPHTLFIDTLKDEKRKEEKALGVGGTRVFCNSPLDYVIECRQYFMHFIAAFMANRRTTMHAVGINPTSAEWGHLVASLLRKNSELVTIDYTNFGPGYNAGVAEMAYEIMIQWLDANVLDFDTQYARILVWECIQSHHICNNTVYKQVGGSPSGAVFTTIVNTIVNQLYVLLAWNALLGSELTAQGIPCIKAFKKHVELYTYGDDLIMAVSPEYVSKFNGKTITSYFATYNIVATNATKTSEIVATTPLSGATFLKRGFLPHTFRRDQWLSPLDWNSILGATQWVWQSPNRNESTMVNCEAALLQAHGHGVDQFQKLKEIINKHLKKIRMPAVTLQWEEIDKMYFSTGLESILDSLINY